MMGNLAFLYKSDAGLISSSKTGSSLALFSADSDFGDSELSQESSAKAKEADDGLEFYVGVALVALCAISIMVWRRRMQ